MTFKFKMTIGLICILAITPLIITPFYIDFFYFPKIFFVYAIAMSMGGLWFLNRKQFIYQESFSERMLKYYLLLLVLSTFFSINYETSLLGGVYREEGLFAIIAYVLIFFVALKHYDFSSNHVMVILLSTTVIATYGILQYFGYDPILRDVFRENWRGRAFSTMGNPNFLGAYLVLMLPISTYAYLYSRKTVYLLASGITYFALLCTMTRGSWIGAFVGITVLFIYAIRYKYSLKHLSIVLMLFMIITIFLNYYSDGGVYGRFQTIQADVENVMSQAVDYEKAGAHRIFIWVRVIALIKDRPLMGYGLETLGIVFTERFHDDVMGMYGKLHRFDKAHNEYLHIAVSTGIPSLFLYLSFVSSIVYKAFKNANRNPLIIPLLCSIIGYLVQAFFNISVVSVAYVYWIFLGILFKFSLNAERLDGKD